MATTDQITQGATYIVVDANNQNPQKMYVQEVTNTTYYLVFTDTPQYSYARYLIIDFPSKFNVIETIVSNDVPISNPGGGTTTPIDYTP